MGSPQPLLSIIVPSFMGRVRSHFPNMMDELSRQAGNDPRVEILAFVDNQRQSIGRKMARLSQAACGLYTVAVGDDDRLDPGYISTLLQEIEHQKSKSGDGSYLPHAITFGMEVHSVTPQGTGLTATIYESVDSPNNDRDKVWYRPISERSAILTTIKREVPHRDWWYGEDVEWNLRAAPFIHTCSRISAVLYTILYDGSNPWGWDWKRERNRALGSDLFVGGGEVIDESGGTSIFRDMLTEPGFVLRPCCVMYGSQIGAGTKIGSHCVIQDGVRIGARCKIQSHVIMGTGLTVEDEVFIGASVIFMNDRNPTAVDDSGRVKGPKEFEVLHTVVEKGAVIGCGAIIAGGIRIGAGAFICAGSLVTRDVPAKARVAGRPANRQNSLFPDTQRFEE